MEKIAVILIVTLALLSIVRTFWKSFKKGNCGCASCHTCSPAPNLLNADGSCFPGVKTPCPPPGAEKDKPPSSRV